MIRDKKQCMRMLVIGVCSLSVFGIIFTLLRANFHADSAFYNLLAEAQRDSGQFFPDGMRYSTVLFVRTLNLLIVPLRSFLSDWILCRQIAVVICWIAILCVIYFSFSIRGDENRNASFLACIFMTIPFIGSELVDMFFYQAAYLSVIFDVSCGLLIAHLLLREMNSTVRNRKKIIILFVILELVMIIPNLGDIRAIELVNIPLFFAFLVYEFLKQGYDLERVRKNKWVVGICLAIFLGSVVAFSGNQYLNARYWGNGKELPLSDANAFFINVLVYLGGVLSLYGNGAATLVSVFGMYRFVNYFFAILTMFVIPVFAIVKYRSFKREYTRFLTLYTTLSNVFLIIVCMAVGITTSRYSTSIYVNNILMFAAVVSEVMENQKAYLKRVVYALLILYVFVCHGCFWMANRAQINQRPQDGLISFLEENDLTYGYADFWDSYQYTVLSNGAVTILSIGDHTDDEEAYDVEYMHEWLTNVAWYDVAAHPGRCFVMMNSSGNLQEKYIAAADQVLQYEDYTIYVYESNERLRSL